MEEETVKEWQGYCEALINQLKNEQKGKLGAHKGTVKKMIHTLKTVKEYPDLMNSLFHFNLVD